MDILSSVILGITALFLVSGALFGFKRGFVRSVVRLILLGIAFVVTWVTKPTYVAAALGIEFGGKTIAETIVSSLGDAGAFADVIMTLVESLLGIVMFILVFLALKFVTLILFGIMKAFFPKRSRIIGFVVGALQGALIAFAICAPLNGLICDAGRVLELEIQGKPLLSEEQMLELEEKGVDFDKYKSSTISRIYTTVGGGFYKSIASSELGGETVSISGTVEAAEASTKLVDALESVNGIDFSAGLTAESREELRETFKELDDIKNGMSGDAQKTINTLISTVVSESAGEGPIPEEISGALEELDFTEVNFVSEGEILISIMDYAENNGEGEVDANELVNSLTESTVIVPMMSSMIDSGKATASIPEEKHAELSAAIDSLDDADKAETIRKVLGLN